MLLDEVNFEKSKDKKRVGRGISAGGGKTAGRGTKGQKSRSGYSRRTGFEGGQTPLFRRLPKLKGFKQIKAQDQTVSIDNLSRLSVTDITLKSLAEAHLIKTEQVGAKLVGNQKLDKAYTVDGVKVSGGAKKAIEDAGGTVKQ